MAYDGSIRIDTSVDGSGVVSGVNKMKNSIKSIAGALGVVKLVSTAFDTLKSSISSAFDRSDTMEQFDRTMSKITGDSEAAGKALETLKGATKGTAYGLDVAAKATQNFVTRGMDMDKATSQVATWADAVAFYGRGTNEQFESVTDALAKMRTKGKVDMEQLDRLFDVGIDAVGMYAKATGQSSANTQKALSDGKISANDFIDTVSEAMATGTGGVQKIAGAAKEAGASWQGTMDNMKAACTRGMLVVIESIDNGLKSINLPTLRESISGIGKMAEETLGKLSGTIGKVIQEIGPPVVSAFDTFKLAFKNSIPSIKEVVAAVYDFVKEIAKSLQSGGLKQAIRTAGELFKNFSKVTAGVAKTVLPVFAKAIDTVAKNIDIILPLATGLVGAFKAYKIIQDVSAKMKALSAAIDTARKAKEIIIVATKLHAATIAKEAAATEISTAAISIKQLMIGTLTRQIGIAEAAQWLWNTAMNANPIGVIITLIGGMSLAIGGLCLALNNGETSTKAFNETTELIGKGVDSFREGISGAESHLSDFNDTLFASAEEQQQLQDNMDAVQNGITNICRTATAERRDYTAQEIQQLDTYFAKLNELNNRELEIQQAKSTAIKQQALTAAQTYTGSLEDYQTYSQEWIATAREQSEKEKELIGQQTTEELALLNVRFGDSATLQNEEYKNAYDTLLRQKQEKLALTDESMKEISAAFANGYAEQTILSDENMKKTNEFNAALESENQRHADQMKAVDENRAIDGNLSSARETAEIEKHNQNVKNLWADLTSGMTDEQKEQMGVLLGMSAQTDLYGGQLNEKTATTVNGIIDAYDSMPKKTKEIMSNTMKPMLEEMEKSEPSLFSKAKDIASGIINKLKSVFEVHSPSRATRRVFKFLWAGAELETDKQAPGLIHQAGSVAQSVMDSISGIAKSKKPFSFALGVSGIDTSGVMASLQNAVMANQLRMSAGITAASVQNIVGKIDTAQISNAVTQGLENAKIAIQNELTAEINADGKVLGKVTTPYSNQNTFTGARPGKKGFA